MKKYHAQRIMAALISIGFMFPFFWFFPQAAAIVTMFVMFLLGYGLLLALIFTWDL